MEKVATNESLVLTLLKVIRTHILWVLILFPIARGLFKRYASPLRKYPGPFIASCSRIWMFCHVHWGHFEHDLMELHKKYGSYSHFPRSTLFPSDQDSKDDILFSSCGKWERIQTKIFKPKLRSAPKFPPKLTFSIKKVPSFAFHRIQFPSPVAMRPKSSSPWAKGSARRISTGSFHHPKIRTSSPKFASGSTLR